MHKKKNLKKLGILVFVAIALTWFLEYRYFMNNAGVAWNFMFERTAVFFFNAWLMFLILVIFVGIFGSVCWGTGSLSAIIILITYINIHKFSARGTPLLPEDFQLASEASSLSQFVDAWSIVRLVIAIILVFVLTFVVSKITKEKPSKKILARVTTILIAGLLFLTTTDFIRNNEGGRYEKIEWLNTTFTAWNQTRNYDENGFIVGFLYNWGKFKLTAPENYSEVEIHRIKTKYEEIAEKENANKESLSDKNYNIVVILNESFYDPELIKEYYPYTGGDITPNLHKIMNENPSGYMYTLDYGGGTANIEFEVLTSLTNYWINAVPYTNLIPKAGNIPSIASFAKENGYEALAIHPYNGGMYKRNIALFNQGFDTFITEKEIRYKEHEGTSEYINDRSAYNEVLDTLREKDGKQMIALITMQNHTPYNSETYAENNFKLQVLNEEENLERKSDIETYFQTLYKSDEYLGEFIESLNTLDEETVVLFFGDHSAGLFHELNDSDNDSIEFITSRTTPYFIYSNFGIEKQDLPKTTPNCLVDTLYNTLNVKKPALSYLTNAVCKEQPILAQTYFGNNALKETKLLDEYKLVTYDILSGKKYWEN